MIIALLAAAAVTATQPAAPHQPLAEAAHALEAGRVEQARLMIANAVQAGAQGQAIDRLLADYAFASGDDQRALPAYRTLLLTHRDDARLHERAGIAAIRVGELVEAERLLERATLLNPRSWRAWNARGVAADFRRDWERADAAYAEAAELAPGKAEVLNNIGWSLLVRGRWSEAVALLERAHAIDPKGQRIAANLELARAAVNEDLPQRRPGESETDWAARLNDAGVVARVQGKNRKAIAAFTRAIEARSTWFERAANNLEMAERAK